MHAEDGSCTVLQPESCNSRHGAVKQSNDSAATRGLSIATQWTSQISVCEMISSRPPGRSKDHSSLLALRSISHDDRVIPGSACMQRIIADLITLFKLPPKARIRTMTSSARGLSLVAGSTYSRAIRQSPSATILRCHNFPGT